MADPRMEAFERALDAYRFYLGLEADLRTVLAEIEQLRNANDDLRRGAQTAKEIMGLVEELRRAPPVRSAPRKATVADVNHVEEIVGMGCGAWDTVDPARIIEAAWSLRSAPTFTQQDVADIQETAEGMRAYYGSAKENPPYDWEVSVDFWTKRARRLRDLADRISRSLTTTTKE